MKVEISEGLGGGSRQHDIQRHFAVDSIVLDVSTKDKGLILASMNDINWYFSFSFALFSLCDCYDMLMFVFLCFFLVGVRSMRM